ncbi:esterase-like activity of phytase family protein [Cellulomonas edaphi]|uniref:Esterase-like activity of phytase family protein n=1 Tax=Cellulomonas edaphi TaxID=3053468 RepID=A0ABT7S3L2_9CELL|nr:esterase-like activity of phytase family protein [Cellulomons edaphi]MDM7830207.1 esterase-like activity of phytase family protein [Cellulomons edaphi]
MLPVPPRRRGRTLTAAAATLAVAAVSTLTGALGAQADTPEPGWSEAGWTAPPADRTFHRLATYPVFQNRPATSALADPTVAEISAVSEDGTTFVHTDALARRIGFVDITDPAHPVGKGTLDLAADLGLAAHAEPTSVAVVGGYVLVVVDTSPSFTAPSGVLVVVDLASHTVVRTLELGGQPDSIALSPDKTHAAIAIENQRDEELKPAGGSKGDLPQAPGGFVQLVDLPSKTAPADWSLRRVDLPESALAGVTAPSDPEPEYVAIDPTGSTVALTLQENNGVVLIDIASGTIDKAFTAGSVAVSGIDVVKNAVIDQTGSIPATPREPDAIAWLDATHVATANEGDWKGGTRGWSVFDTTTGLPVWDAGNSLERLAVRTGLHSEDRAAKKGVEIEGLAVATLGGTPYAFVGSERSNFVAVYDVSDALDPAFVQVLATTNGPEGILPVPSRDLLLVSSETDDAAKNVRSSVTVFGRGPAFASAPATFPSVVSADVAGSPIGWGALGALTPDRADATHLWSATDAAYADTRLLSLDVSKTPVVIDRAVRVTEGGAGVTLDVEGIASRPAGGFWLGVEGATGAGNQLVRTSDAGAVEERVSLPAEVAAGLDKWGIEGVTTLSDDAGEHVWVALQRGLSTDPGGLAGTARLGRYDVATQAWTWFAYPLETTAVTGDWLGLSEVVAVDDDTLAVIERDKLNGPAAAVKRIYTVEIPADPAPGAVAPLTKTLAHDVLPDLRATAGWTQEKLEGLTIGIDGQVYAVTDNDGVLDATGETVFLRLGSTSHVFGPAATSTALAVSGVRSYGTRQTLSASVAPQAATGTVTFRDGTRSLGTVPVAAGTAVTSTALGVGTHALSATFTPSGSDWAGSTSTVATVTIARSASTTKVRVPTTSFGTAATATVTVAGATAPATGTVEIREGDKRLATGRLVVTGRTGKAVVTLPRTLAVGKHALRAVYAGTTTVTGSSGAVSLTVTKARPKVAISSAAWTVKKHARPVVTVTVSGPVAPSGSVTVRVDGKKVATKAVHSGRVSVRLPRIVRASTVTATYEGSSSYVRVSVTHKVRVR